MNRVFVDTSGFYASLNRRDAYHRDAARLFCRAHREGIVKLIGARKNLFHLAGISFGSEALTSHLARYNGLELTSTSHSTTVFCRSDP